MTYLIDVSTLLAWIWRDHEHHNRVMVWQSGKAVATCPLTELGFLRVSTQSVFGASIEEARQLLNAWQRKSLPAFLPCDLPALKGTPPPFSSRTTDFYLGDLARKYGMLWATLDGKSGHPCAFVIP